MSDDAVNTGRKIRPVDNNKRTREVMNNMCLIMVLWLLHEAVVLMREGRVQDLAIYCSSIK